MKNFKNTLKLAVVALTATTFTLSQQAVSAASADTTEWKANTVEQVKEALQKEQSETGKNQYTVKYGDTLWAISQASGVNIDTLVAVNNIANRDLIYPETILTFTESAMSNEKSSVMASTDKNTNQTNYYRTENQQSAKEVKAKDLTVGEVKEIIKSNPDLAKDIEKTNPEAVEKAKEEIKKEQEETTVAPTPEPQKPQEPEVTTPPVVEETTQAPAPQPEPQPQPEPETTQPTRPEPDPSQMVNFGDHTYVGYAYTLDEVNVLAENVLLNTYNEDGTLKYGAYFWQEHNGVIYVYAELTKK